MMQDLQEERAYYLDNDFMRTIPYSNNGDKTQIVENPELLKRGEICLKVENN